MDHSIIPIIGASSGIPYVLNSLYTYISLHAFCLSGALVRRYSRQQGSRRKEPRATFILLLVEEKIKYYEPVSE